MINQMLVNTAIVKSLLARKFFSLLFKKTIRLRSMVLWKSFTFAMSRKFTGQVRLGLYKPCTLPSTKV